MRKRKALLILVCLLLSVAALLPAVASAAETSGSIDLSRPGSVHNKTFTAADVAEYFLDSELCTAERDYLIAFADGAVIYNDGVSTRDIAATLDEDEGVLYVSAYPYEYTATDGTLVTWIPVTAALGDDEQALVLDSGAYVAAFSNAMADPDLHSVNVVYALDVTIDAEILEELLECAYRDAPAVEQELARLQEDYDLRMEAYYDYLHEYELYLYAAAEHEEQSRAYAAYVIEKAAYDERLAEYERYMSDLAAYNAQNAAYLQYQQDLLQYAEDVKAYRAYEQAMSDYFAKKSAYDAYYATARLCAVQLSAIELTKVKMTLGRTVYDALNSELVDNVIAEKDTITSSAVGVSPDVVDMAGNATQRLRVLLDDYFALETDAAKYVYYSNNYVEFRDNFRNLFVSLDHLYKNTLVRSQAISGGRDEKYRILVAQLYIISQALTDGPLLSIDPSYVAAGSGNENKNYVQFVYTDETFRIDVQKYSVTDILGTTPYIEDSENAAPVIGGYPTAVDRPTEPAKVAVPVEPTPVDKPASVDYVVENPGYGPPPVEDPGEPPRVVNEPQKPDEYVPDPKKVALVAAYYDGTLTERDVEITEDPVLRIEKTVQKRFIGAEEVTVYFIGTDGSTVIYSSTADKGGSVDFEGEEPYIPEDDRAYYTFLGWKTESGERPDLSSVDGDMVLYPDFLETVKEYDVTFRVDGTDTVLRLPYGATPEYPSLPVKPEDSYYYYVFDGWDKQIVPVVGDTCYTAVFSKEYILPTSSGGGSLTLDGTVYVADFAAANYSSYGIVGALERAADISVALRVNVNTVSIYFTVSAVKAAVEAGVEGVSVEFSMYASDRYTYVAHLLDHEGDSIASDVRIELSFYQPDTVENDRMKLSYVVDGERQYTKYSIADDRLSFSAVPGREYTLQVEYRANLIFVGMADASLSGDVFIEDAFVGLSVSVPDGVRVTDVYYLNLEGERVDISGNGFRMPASDVSVYVQTEVIKYRITFVCDGVIMKTVYCTYGELPEPPEDPKKSSNGEFNYTFAGWSEEIQPATEVKVYVAVFDSTPVPEAPDAAPAGDSIYDKAMKGMLGVAAAVVVCILGAVIAVFRRR